jgi:tetratricopeptide (TPR) repeat protein
VKLPSLVLFPVLVGLLILPHHAAAQEHPHEEQFTTERLGTVSFPTSCSPIVQTGFNRAVALLHSFGYDQAHKQFQVIEHDDPACGMAYWGEAMSLYHQLWDRPSPADLVNGSALIEKAEAAGPKTPREQGYIKAAAAFYPRNAKTAFEARWEGYSHAMGQLHREFPEDNEAAIFYALSLVASPHANDNDFALRRRAVGILNTVLHEEPDHPGVAHYLIHACDNPEMAKDGLAAARRYAQIAPASAHALHMPSHIFARLGMWQDDIQSNLASKATAEKQGSTPARAHAMDFLEYAYLQTGQTSRAKAIEEEALRIKKKEFSDGMDDYFYYIQVHFPPLFNLETRDWKAAEALTPMPNAAPDFQAVTLWANAVGAGHLHDMAAARIAVEKYDQALEAVKKSSYAYVAEGMSNSRDEAHAWLKFVEGKDFEAVNLLRETADRQDKTGKREVELPAREMLADMLFELHRPAEALMEYERSLHTDPNRFNALAGAARAAEAVQKRDLTRTYYQHLLENCPAGDRSELQAARAYLKEVESAGNSAH